MVASGWGAGLVLLAVFVAAASLEAPEARAAPGGDDTRAKLLEELDGTVLLAEANGVRTDTEFVSELDTKKTEQESKRKTDEMNYKNAERVRIANEVAAKNAVNAAKAAALATGDATAIAAEAESKREQLALAAEQAVEDRHERENKDALVAFGVLVNQTKQEIRNKFLVQVDYIRNTASVEGAKILTKSKETGRKAFESEAVRTESRNKKRARDGEENRVKKTMKFASVNRVIADEKATKKMEIEEMNKKAEKGQKLREVNMKKMAQPFFAEKQTLQDMLDKNAKVQDKIEKGKIKPAMPIPANASPVTVQLVTSLNNVAAGLYSEESIRAAELKAGITRRPTPQPSPTPPPTVDQEKADQDIIKNGADYVPPPNYRSPPPENPAAASPSTTTPVPVAQAGYDDAVKDWQSNHEEHFNENSDVLNDKPQMGETLNAASHSRVATMDNSKPQMYNPLSPQPKAH